MPNSELGVRIQGRRRVLAPDATQAVTVRLRAGSDRVEGRPNSVGTCSLAGRS
jgi:hypothetical protein